jgi:hypothetical protein
VAEYTPAYRQAPPFTLEALGRELEMLHVMHGYATRHDDTLVLDELVCRLVRLEHVLLLWDREREQLPQVRDSLRALDRALKWAWLAREEEAHASGLYAGKLKEAIAGLEDLRAFLVSRSEHEPAQETREERHQMGMTREVAEELAGTIKARLPQAEVEMREGEQGVWVVEARNPRRGTTQLFQTPEQFQALMQAATHR